jgi:hypothetical protein
MDLQDYIREWRMANGEWKLGARCFTIRYSLFAIRQL